MTREPIDDARQAMDRIQARVEEEQELLQTWNAWHERGAWRRVIDEFHATGRTEAAKACELAVDRLPNVTLDDAVAANDALVRLLTSRRAQLEQTRNGTQRAQATPEMGVT